VKTLRLHIGRKDTGISVVPDLDYPDMWRVRRPGDWRAPVVLSPMMSLTWAKGAALRIASPRGLASDVTARWLPRETASESRQRANAARR
jgi:hypothetical protein